MVDLFEAPEPMRAISLWEPWASLWCAGVKIHETRHWPTRHLGLLAVHAAKTWSGELRSIADIELQPAIEVDERLVRRFSASRPQSLGCIVGVVRLESCLPMRTARMMQLMDSERCAIAADDMDALCGDWTPGRYGWRAESPVLFDTPIPTRGRQGFWTLEDDVAEQVRARLAT